MSAPLRLAACLLLALAAPCHPARAQGGGKAGSQQPGGRDPIVVRNTDVVIKGEEEGFEAVFPSAPTRRLFKGDPAVEKPDVVQYDLRAPGEFYSVRVADYNFAVTDPAKLAKFYELVKQEYLERASRLHAGPPPPCSARRMCCWTGSRAGSSSSRWAR